MSETAMRAMSVVGFAVLLGVAWLCSSHRKQIDWRAIAWGVGIQWLLAAFLLGTRVGEGFFDGVAFLISRLIDYTTAGSTFLFGPLLGTGFSFALHVLPIIIFMGSLFGALYHLGLVQPLVQGLARLLSRTMRVSGAESMAAVANLFVGMVESAIVIRPYLARMTRSELFSFMTLGMSTIAGSVLVAYVQILGGGPFAGHLVAASLMSAPAGLVVAKLMVPETEQPETLGATPRFDQPSTHNVIDAAAEGGLAGLRLALNIGALILAFVALIAMVNSMLSGIGGTLGFPDVSLEGLLGVALAPVAFLMGVPWNEAREVASLIGIKTVLNEFIAYQDLASAIADGRLSPRSAVIASYALCGFANFGSLAILLGGVHGIAPERRSEAASLGLKSILAGTIATCMTGCLAGLMTGSMG